MIIGILVLAGMFIWTGHGSIAMFMDLHSFFVVAVGTASIGLIATPFKDFKNFIPMIMVVARGQKDDWMDLVNIIVEMADKARTDIQSLKAFKDRIKDPFLGDGIDLVINGFEAKDIQTIMTKRMLAQNERYARQTKMFKGLGKYPPACGLLGTVLGMIVLLGSLGQEGAANLIGPSMSVALTATLYGVIGANFVILPMADNLAFITMETSAKRQMIIEGLMLLKKKESPIIIHELMLSHIPPSKRGAVKSAA
jgi:chemotaxis protein MotA